MTIKTAVTGIHRFEQFMLLDPDGTSIELSQPPAGLEDDGPFSPGAD